MLCAKKSAFKKKKMNGYAVKQFLIIKLLRVLLKRFFSLLRDTEVPRGFAHLNNACKTPLPLAISSSVQNKKRGCPYECI